MKPHFYSTRNGHSIFRIIKPDQIAACLFGLVHRHIRPLENIFRAGFVIDEQRYADTRRAMVEDCKLAAVKRKQPDVKWCCRPIEDS